MKFNNEELTKEEIADLIAVSIFGFCVAIKGVDITKKDLRSIRHATIQSLNENKHFLKEMVSEYDIVYEISENE